jgi:hypothetical protein
MSGFPAWVQPRAEYTLNHGVVSSSFCIAGSAACIHPHSALSCMQVVGESGIGKSSKLPFTSSGCAMNSSSDTIDFTGKNTDEAKAQVLRWLVSSATGRAKVNFKLRDWLFARQRYWGEPFPVVYPEGTDTIVPLPLDQLPLNLPNMEDFRPSGTPESPLVKATEWLQATDPIGGGPARRDTNTMPQWAGSCWYYLRFIDPRNSDMCAFPTRLPLWLLLCISRSCSKMPLQVSVSLVSLEELSCIIYGQAADASQGRLKNVNTGKMARPLSLQRNLKFHFVFLSSNFKFLCGGG